MDKGKNNILYIDDEYNNLVVFENAFFTDYNIFTATSAEEGLEIIKREDIHLVITDQKMPKMSGIEFLEKIKPLYPDVMTMIITAYSDMDIILPAINRCGIYSYILKPWKSDELKITIDNALAKYKLKKDNERLLDNLKKSNEELEKKVRNRTKEIELKNKELKKLNNLKDKLFTVISHDLRQPVLSLDVFLETLRQLKGNMPEEKIGSITESIQYYITEVKIMIDNLLNWAQLQMEGKKVARKSFNINREMLKNIELYYVIAKQKQISISFNESEKELKVLGDKEMSRVILRNLISNAVKFTGKNGKVQCEVGKQNGYAVVKIKDNGIGIRDDIKNKFFIENEQISTRGTANEKGVGLGLKICKEFVEKQGGTIGVDSKPGKGSTFSFTIPLASLT